MEEKNRATYQSLPDTEIIQKILGGEKLLFELLMRRTNALLYKVGRSYRFNHEDTEDLMQEAHIAAYMNLFKFESRSQYKTWITKIMLNKCIYKMSKMEHREKLTSLDQVQNAGASAFGGPQAYDTEKQVLNSELSRTLEKVIGEIPLDYRMVFMLREKEGFDVAETAEILNISESNVKVRLNRAKGMLRQKFEHYYSNLQVFEFNLVYCDKIVNNVMLRLR